MFNQVCVLVPEVHTQTPSSVAGDPQREAPLLPFVVAHPTKNVHSEQFRESNLDSSQSQLYKKMADQLDSKWDPVGFVHSSARDERKLERKQPFFDFLHPF